LADQSDWHRWLPYATFVFNTTGFTPHELLFGRKPNIPGILQKETPEIQYTYDNYVKPVYSQVRRERGQIFKLIRKKASSIMIRQ
jgi:hypothetical protein